MTAVIAVQARELERVRVSFDEPVKQVDPLDPGDALNPALYTITRQSAPAVDAIVERVEGAGEAEVDLVFDLALTPAASYLLQVGSVVGSSGDAVAPGSGVAFTGFVPPSPAGRNFKLVSFLPEVNRREDDTGDLRRFLACLDEVTTLLLADVDSFTDILDPDIAPEPVLDLMLGELGNPFAFDLSTIDKRRLLNVLVVIYRQKGTATGIKNAVRFFLGLEVELVSWTDVGLVLGESALGVDWILGSGRSKDRYSFEIVVPRLLEDEERSRLRIIVEYMKPAHTHLRALLEPTPPPVIDHVELGRSELGETWILH